MLALTVVDLLQLIQQNTPETMYRGQTVSDWPLLPSLARFAAQVEGYESAIDLEEHLLDDFLRYAVPHNDIRGLPKLEQLIHCQHFGLPTRLLDWSTNPLKALFFAVENPLHDDKEGAVYVLSPSGWWEGTGQIPDLDSLHAFMPELLNERVAAQDACFVSFPLPSFGMEVRELTRGNYIRDVATLSKIIVPRQSKMELRRELAVLGITHRTIYPGLEGVARWVKTNLSNFRA